jgi:hypothetical protein
MYGNTIFSSLDRTAIIDSGSGFIGIPDSDFESLQRMMQIQVPTLYFNNGYMTNHGKCYEL